MVWNILTWGSKVETETVKAEVETIENSDEWVVLDKPLSISEVFDEFVDMEFGSESDLEIKVSEVVTNILSGKTLQKYGLNDNTIDIYYMIMLFVRHDKEYNTFSFEKLAKYGKTSEMVEFMAEEYIKRMKL